MAALLIFLATFGILGQVAHGADWNSLIRSENLFPSQVNTIRSSLNDTTGVKSELRSLLDQRDVLSQIYRNFQVKLGEGNKAAGPVGAVDRLSIFRQSIEDAAAHNLDAQQGQYSWVKAVNLFSDKTFEEKLKYTGDLLDGGNSTAAMPTRSFIPIPRWLPDEVDLRKNGYVSAVKNQGSCGSCVMFAAAALVESRRLSLDGLYKRPRVEMDLSEQELLDCAQGLEFFGNMGCGGNYNAKVLDYIAKYGVTNEQEYPYEGVQRTCRRAGKSRRVKLVKYKPQYGADEMGMKAVSFFYGPIMTAMRVSNDFYAYGGGVFDGDCASGGGHAIVIVGYGNDAATGKDYWTLKNSWGANWGESGFFRIRRNYNDFCGVMRQGIYIDDAEYGS